MITITINGQTRTVDGNTNIQALLEASGAPACTVAVARNSEVVPRSAWADVHLADGDVVEIVRPVAGG